MCALKSLFTKSALSSENKDVCCGCPGSKEPCPIASFPLSLTDEGERVRIVMLRKGRKLHERLGSMGLHIEDVITVIKKQPGGGTIIEKAGSRYALGGGMSLKINVIRCE